MKKIILLCAVIAAAAVHTAAQEQGSVSAGYKVGGYEVFVLTEGGGDGNPGILIDAPAEVMARYAPDGTFPIATNAVLVKGNGLVWLIDTGYGRNLFRLMESLGVRPGDVDRVFLTHMHGDHVGGMLSPEGTPVFERATVVVGDRELDYWTSEAEMGNVPEARRGGFLTARKIEAQYGSRIERVQALSVDGDYADGIFPMAAYGHTPGHTMFLISDGGEKLLVWGDLTHAMAVQMPHPEISVTYDVDPDLARRSRLEVLEYLAGRDIAVVGMHVPAPQPGRVVKDTTCGGYRFEPIP